MNCELIQHRKPPIGCHQYIVIGMHLVVSSLEGVISHF